MNLASKGLRSAPSRIINLRRNVYISPARVMSGVKKYSPFSQRANRVQWRRF